MEANQARDGCVASSVPMLARSLGPLVKTRAFGMTQQE